MKDAEGLLDYRKTDWLLSPTIGQGFSADSDLISHSAMSGDFDVTSALRKGQDVPGSSTIVRAYHLSFCNTREKWLTKYVNSQA